MLRILPYAHTKDSFCCLQSLILHSAPFKTAAVCFGWRKQTGTGCGYITPSILLSLSSSRPKRWEYYGCTTVFELAFCSSSAEKAWHYNTKTLVLKCVVWLNTNSGGFELARGVKAPTLYLVWTTDPLSRNLPGIVSVRLTRGFLFVIIIHVVHCRNIALEFADPSPT